MYVQCAHLNVYVHALLFYARESMQAPMFLKWQRNRLRDGLGMRDQHSRNSGLVEPSELLLKFKFGDGGWKF